MTANKKHPCPDCKMCQWCSDDRCRLCLKSGCRKKLSITEQIELYESLNTAENKKKCTDCADRFDIHRQP